MDTASTIPDLASFDFGVVTLGYLDTRAEDALDDHSLDDLFGTLSL